MNNQVSKIRLYSCGGAGINIGKEISSKSDRYDVAFLDSSLSNLQTVNDQSKTFLIKDMDGAGKLRAKTYEAFKDEIEAAITQLKPSDVLNVVVSSLSGGTGSVIAPLVAKELLEQGKSVIVVGIASDDSIIEIDNTIKSIKTYNNFAHAVKMPVSMFYCPPGVRGMTDKTVISLLVSLGVITDSQNTEEFDTADLHHFINYQKVTQLPVGLSNIFVSLNDEPLKELERSSSAYVASTILITVNRDSKLSGDAPEYLAKVIVTDPEYKNRNGESPSDIRIDNVIGRLPEMISDLESNLQEAKDRVKTSRINKIDVVEGIDDTGMVI